MGDVEDVLFVVLVQAKAKQFHQFSSEVLVGMLLLINKACCQMDVCDLDDARRTLHGRCSCRRTMQLALDSREPAERHGIPATSRKLVNDGK